MIASIIIGLIVAIAVTLMLAGENEPEFIHVLIGACAGALFPLTIIFLILWGMVKLLHYLLRGI